MEPKPSLREQVRRDDAFREGHRLCPGCLEATALHAIGRASDNGRKTVIALGTFCGEAGTLHFPDVVAWGRGAEPPERLEKTVGVIQAPSEAAPSVAEGIRAAADALAELGAWAGPPPNVVAITGDVGAVCGGLEALLHTLHRGRAVATFVLLHEVYGASHFPVPATSLSVGTDPVDHVGLAITAGASLVAQVSPSWPALFAEIAQAALACPESSVVFVPAPCLSGWRIDEGQAGSLARLQCETGIAPGFRKRRGEKGELLNLPPIGKRPPVVEFLARQQRFEHLARWVDGKSVVVPGREAEVAALQAFADRNVARLEALAARP